MRIPVGADIPQEKLTHYLLLPKARNDKSKFLAQAGFTQEHPDALRLAIVSLTQSTETVEDGNNEYGVFYRIEGTLQGINGRNLAVIIIWIRWDVDNSFHFVTLKPQREPRT
ncbi:MAG: hypothetical protein HC769_09995 [Cyanobacteria bacterium CRU_2_1]|nr:hypothetical protein [Cyanobacteria bacterium RU_5_0]NJR59143.1 hypothetical protein [Cyanobacteria bacterium CRU_2_1]